MDLSHAVGLVFLLVAAWVDRAENAIGVGETNQS